jgi:hypothetical protein
MKNLFLFEVLKAAVTNVAVFWIERHVVRLWAEVSVKRRFTYGLRGALS